MKGKEKEGRNRERGWEEVVAIDHKLHTMHVQYAEVYMIYTP